MKQRTMTGLSSQHIDEAVVVLLAAIAF